MLEMFGIIQFDDPYHATYLPKQLPSRLIENIVIISADFQNWHPI